MSYRTDLPKKISIVNIQVRDTPDFVAKMIASCVDQKHPYVTSIRGSIDVLLQSGHTIPASTYEKGIGWNGQAQLEKTLRFTYRPSETGGILEITGSEYSIDQAYKTLRKQQEIIETPDVPGLFYRNGVHAETV